MSPIFIGILQFVLATFSIIQLVQGAIVATLLSIFLIYLLGAFEDSPVIQMKIENKMN